MLNKDLKLKVFNSAQWTGMAVLRACITDVGGFDAVSARPLSTIKETIFYLKRKHNYWTVNPKANEQ